MWQRTTAVPCTGENPHHVVTRSAAGGITEIIKLAHLAEAFGAVIYVQAGDSMWGFAPLHANGGSLPKNRIIRHNSHCPGKEQQIESEGDICVWF